MSPHPRTRLPCDCRILLYRRPACRGPPAGTALLSALEHNTSLTRLSFESTYLLVDSPGIADAAAVLGRALRCNATLRELRFHASDLGGADAAERLFAGVAGCPSVGADGEPQDAPPQQQQAMQHDGGGASALSKLVLTGGSLHLLPKTAYAAPRRGLCAALRRAAARLRWLEISACNMYDECAQSYRPAITPSGDRAVLSPAGFSVRGW